MLNRYQRFVVKGMLRALDSGFSEGDHPRANNGEFRAAAHKEAATAHKQAHESHGTSEYEGHAARARELSQKASVMSEQHGHPVEQMHAQSAKKDSIASSKSGEGRVAQGMQALRHKHAAISHQDAAKAAKRGMFASSPFGRDAAPAERSKAPKEKAEEPEDNSDSESEMPEEQGQGAADIHGRLVASGFTHTGSTGSHEHTYVDSSGNKTIVIDRPGKPPEIRILTNPAHGVEPYRSGETATDAKVFKVIDMTTSRVEAEFPSKQEADKYKREHYNRFSKVIEAEGKAKPQPTVSTSGGTGSRTTTGWRQ